MAVIRAPYPNDPHERRRLFARAAALLSRHGRYEGTPEAGIFEGHTPVGRFAGRYHSPEGSGELVIELTHKPWLVPAALVESEVRRLLTSV